MLVPSSTIVVSDTSVLINFLRIDRMGLLAALPYAFLATNHVGAESPTATRINSSVTTRRSATASSSRLH